MYFATAPGLVWHGLTDGFTMFWDIGWTLALGFGLSGIVRSFVNRSKIERALGSHRPAAIARATIAGALSSSCSYAASGTANTLYELGADFVTATVFMIASTNLVIELGLSLVVLMGWQFLAAEAIGGLVMIAVVWIVGPRWMAPVLTRSRERDGDHLIAAQQEGDEKRPFRDRATDAAKYAIGDTRMLSREIVSGFLAAGCLSAFVPQDVWNALFTHGHGLGTALENAVLGPIAALVACVCSVGNVPLAAAIWRGGISFGGAVSFIFGDLIALPLLFSYHRMFGWRITRRLSVLLWFSMALSGLITGELFLRFHWVPGRSTRSFLGQGVHVNYTLVLNCVAGLLAICAYFASRRTSPLKERLAIDPICGMRVDTRMHPEHVVQNGEQFYFCSQRCRERFVEAKTTRSTSR